MKKSIHLMLVMILGISLTVSAQTKNEAGEKFNAAVQLMKDNNTAGAITAFEECIAICEAVGPEADDLKSQSIAQLPGLYYKDALNTYKSKDIPGALVKFETTYEVAEKYEDETTMKKSAKIIPQLYNAIGNSHYKKEEYVEALANFDKAISMNEDYPKAYYGKALVYKKQDDVDNMKASLDLAIEKAEAANDQKTLDKAKRVAYKDFKVRGAKAIQSQSFTKAETYLTEALNYGDGDAKLYYYFTIAYNNLKKYAEAIESGNKAVELEEDDAEKKGIIYFELGNAYTGSGDKVKACEAFSKALIGPNAASAKYQMSEVLKCN